MITGRGTRGLRRWLSLSGVVLTLAFTPLTALDQARAPDQLVVRTWGVRDGLPSQSVHSLAQTPDGFLWAGTSAGLVRFDGRHFKTFNSRNTPVFAMNEVHILAHAPAGTLWLAVARDLVRYRDGIFTPIHSGGQQVWFAAALGGDAVVFLAGNYERGLYTVQEGQLVPYRSAVRGKNLRTLSAGPDGTLWTSTTEPRLMAIGPRGDMTVNLGPEELKPIRSISVVYATPEGDVWITSPGHPARARPTDKGWVVNEMRNLEITTKALIRDRAGTFWVTGLSGERLKRGRPGKNWEAFRSGALLGRTVVNALEDRDGAVWIATWDGGLNQLLDGPFTSFNVHQGVAHNTVRTALVARNGTLWIGGNGGLQRRRPDGGFDTWTSTDGLPHTNVYSLTEMPDGTIVVGTQRGLARLAGNRVFPGPELSRGPAVIHTLLAERDGTISAGVVETGMVRIAPDGQQRIELATENPFVQHVDADGTRWIGTADGLWRRPPSGDFARFTLPTSAPLNVFAIHRDSRGDLWVGVMEGGLYRIRNDRVIAHLSRRNGLHDDTVHGIFEDPEGALWLTSETGVYRLEIRQVDALMHGTTSRLFPRPFGIESGLFSLVFAGGQSPPIAVGRDGMPWFAMGGGGVARLDLRAVGPAPQPPTPLIDALRVDDEVVALHNPVSFAPGSHRVEIDFTAPDLRYADRLRFRYRVRGLSDNWVDAGDRRTIEIPVLGHGDYGLEIASSYDGEHWSAARSFGIGVQALLWERRWFWPSLAALTVVLTALGIRFRLDAVVRRERRTQYELESLVDVGREFTGLLDTDAVTATTLAALERRCGDVWRAIVTRRDQEPPIVRESGPGAPRLSLLDGDESVQLRAAGAVLVVPMVSGASPRGVIAVGPRADGRPYDARDRAHVAGLATQAGIALEGARQVQDAMHWRDTSEARREWGELDVVARLVFVAVAQNGPVETMNEARLRGLLEETLPLLSSRGRSGQAHAPFDRALAHLIDLGALRREADDAIRVARLSWLLLPEIRHPLAEIARDAGGRVGPYRLLARLGAGGMGEVFRGVDVHTGAPAAVKLLYTHETGMEDARRRLQREMEIVASLDHPNIVRLTGRGEHEGRLYLAMELLSGDTLAEAIVTGPLPEAQVRRLANELLSALAALHEQGVVHRDLKPSNVMRVSDGRFILLDMGLARGAGAASITRADTLIGTLPYLAPEVLSGHGHSDASDLWSLGVVLHEALRGELPWHAREPVAIALEIMRLRERPQDLENRGDLDKLIAHLLSPDSSMRGTASGWTNHLGAGSGAMSNASRSPSTVLP